MEDGAIVTSEHVGSGYQTLLMIGMITLHARFPYLARLCRCFLLADILFLGNHAWCKEQLQLGHEIYIGSGPQEASKRRTSSCYSCIAVFGEIVVTM
jgi:hypothetical protein